MADDGSKRGLSMSMSMQHQGGNVNSKSNSSSLRRIEMRQERHIMNVSTSSRSNSSERGSGGGSRSSIHSSGTHTYTYTHIDRNRGGQGQSQSHGQSLNVVATARGGTGGVSVSVRNVNVRNPYKKQNHKHNNEQSQSHIQSPPSQGKSSHSQSHSQSQSLLQTRKIPIPSSVSPAAAASVAVSVSNPYKRSRDKMSTSSSSSSSSMLSSSSSSSMSMSNPYKRHCLGGMDNKSNQSTPSSSSSPINNSNSYSTNSTNSLTLTKQQVTNPYKNYSTTRTGTRTRTRTSTTNNQLQIQSMSMSSSSSISSSSSVISNPYKPKTKPKLKPKPPDHSVSISSSSSLPSSSLPSSSSSPIRSAAPSHSSQRHTSKVITTTKAVDTSSSSSSSSHQQSNNNNNVQSSDSASSSDDACLKKSKSESKSNSNSLQIITRQDGIDVDVDNNADGDEDADVEAVANADGERNEKVTSKTSTSTSTRSSNKGGMRSSNNNNDMDMMNTSPPPRRRRRRNQKNTNTTTTTATTLKRKSSQLPPPPIPSFTPLEEDIDDDDDDEDEEGNATMMNVEKSSVRKDEHEHEHEHEHDILSSRSSRSSNSSSSSKPTPKPVPESSHSHEKTTTTTTTEQKTCSSDNGKGDLSGGDGNDDDDDDTTGDNKVEAEAEDADASGPSPIPAGSKHDSNVIDDDTTGDDDKEVQKEKGSCTSTRSTSNTELQRVELCIIQSPPPDDSTTTTKQHPVPVRPVTTTNGTTMGDEETDNINNNDDDDGDDDNDDDDERTHDPSKRNKVNHEPKHIEQAKGKVVKQRTSPLSTVKDIIAKRSVSEASVSVPVPVSVSPSNMRGDSTTLDGTNTNMQVHSGSSSSSSSQHQTFQNMDEHRHHHRNHNHNHMKRTRGTSTAKGNHRKVGSSTVLLPSSSSPSKSTKQPTKKNDPPLRGFHIAKRNNPHKTSKNDVSHHLHHHQQRRRKSRKKKKKQKLLDIFEFLSDDSDTDVVVDTSINYFDTKKKNSVEVTTTRTRTPCKTEAPAKAPQIPMKNRVKRSLLEDGNVESELQHVRVGKTSSSDVGGNNADVEVTRDRRKERNQYQCDILIPTQNSTNHAVVEGNNTTDNMNMATCTTHSDDSSRESTCRACADNKVVPVVEHVVSLVEDKKQQDEIILLDGNTQESGSETESEAESEAGHKNLTVTEGEDEKQRTDDEPSMINASGSVIQLSQGEDGIVIAEIEEPESSETKGMSPPTAETSQLCEKQTKWKSPSGVVEKDRIRHDDDKEKNCSKVVDDVRGDISTSDTCIKDKKPASVGASSPLDSLEATCTASQTKIPSLQICEEDASMLTQLDRMKDKYLARAKELINRGLVGNSLLEEDFQKEAREGNLVIPSGIAFRKEQEDVEFPDEWVGELASLVQGSPLPIGNLAQLAQTRIMEPIKDDDLYVSIETVASKIKLIATRTQNLTHLQSDAKKVDTFTDESKELMWRWDLISLDLLPSNLRTTVKKARTFRRKLKYHQKALTRLIQAIIDAMACIGASSTDTKKKKKLLAKVSTEEEKVLKYEREEEKTRLSNEAKKQKQLEKQRVAEEKRKAKKLLEETKKCEKAKRQEAKKAEQARILLEKKWENGEEGTKKEQEQNKSSTEDQEENEEETSSSTTQTKTRKRPLAANSKQRKIRKQSTSKRRCTMCLTCSCQSASLDSGEDKLNYENNPLFKLTQTDPEIERALIRRLARLEKSASWFDSNSAKVSRELKRHRSKMKAKMDATSRIGLDKDADNRPKFLDDTLDIEDDRHFGTPNLPKSFVQKATNKTFSFRKKNQPTLTQMLGEDDGSEVEGDNNEVEDELDQVIDFECKDGSTSENEDENDELISKNKDGELVDPNGARAYTEAQLNQAYARGRSRNLWNVSRLTKEEFSIQTNQESNSSVISADFLGLDPKKSSNETISNEHDGTDGEAFAQLLDVFRESMDTNTRDDDGGFSTEQSIPIDNTDELLGRFDNHELAQEPNYGFIPQSQQDCTTLSQLSPRAKRKFYSVEEKLGVESHMNDHDCEQHNSHATARKKLALLEEACPHWKENVCFALHQKDPKDVREALRNVQERREQVLHIQRTLDKQHAVLEVYELALTESLGRLKDDHDTDALENNAM